LLLIINMVHTR